MANNKITKDEIADRELFANVISSAETAIKTISNLNAQFAQLGAIIRDSIGDVKNIKDLLSISREAERLTREKIKTDKELIELTSKKEQAEKKLLEIQTKIDNQKIESQKRVERLTIESQNRIADNQAKANAKIAESNAKTADTQAKTNIQNQKEADRIADRNRREADRQAKEHAKIAKEAEYQANAYKKLVVSTRELKNESKRLGAEMLELERDGRKNTAEYLELAKAYRRVTRDASLADKQLKQLDSEVGDNFRNVGNYKNAVNKLAYALGQMGLAFGVFDGLRYFVDAQIKLNSLQLSLRAVSKDAEEFADNFQFASDVSRKYGQDINQIVDTYKNFIASTNESNVSLARRKELYEQIIKAGSTLALSNDDIEGTLRAVGQIFSKGTLQSEELRQQLGERLPGAFNMMAKAIGVTEVELNKLLKDGVLLGEDVMPLFGKQIEKQLGNASNNKLRTLSGAFNLLKTNIVLAVDKAGEGLKTTERFAGVIRYLGENIGNVIRVFATLITSFTTYKVIASAMDGSIKTFASTLLDATRNILGLKSATDATSASVVKMQTALKGAGWTALIFAISEIAIKVYDIASGWARAREEYNNYQTSISKGKTKAEKFLSKEELEYDRLKLEYTVKIRKEKDKTKRADLMEEANKKLSLKRSETEAEIIKKIAEATQKRDKAERERLKFVQTNKFGNTTIPLRNEKELRDAIKAKKEIIVEDQSILGGLKTALNTKSFFESYSKAENQIIKDERALARVRFKEYSNEIAGLNKEIITYKSELKKSTTITEDFGNAVDDGSKKAKKAVGNYTPPIQKIKFEFKDLEKYIIDVNQALRDLEETANKTKLDEYSKTLDNFVEKSNKSAKLFFLKDESYLKFEKGIKGFSVSKEVLDDYRKQLRKARSEFEKAQVEEGLNQSLLNIVPEIAGSEYYKKIIDSLRDIENIKRKQIDNEANYKKEKLIQEYKEKEEKDADFIKKQIDAFNALEKYKLEVTYANGLIAIDNQNSLDQKQKSNKKAKLKAEQDRAIEVINNTYKNWKENNDKIQDANTIEREKELNKKIEAIDSEANYQKEKLVEETADRTKDINEQIVESAKSGMESMKETAKSVYEYINLILEMMIVQSERRLDKLNQNLDKVKEKQSKLTQLAVNGNIEATQSLALNEKEQARIQKSIEKEQRRIEMLKLAQSVYSTYASYAGNPEIKNPLGKTVSDMTVLSQFVKTLPTFYKGTETDVKTALGNPDLQGKDGYIVRVDGSEKILNPQLSAMTGNMTTYEIAKLAENHRLGKLVKAGDGAIQINKSYETDLLINKLDSLEKAIKNKAEMNVEVGEILGGVMHIVETTKKPNMVTRNIRRYS